MPDVHSPSIDKEEIAKFSAMADDWWNETGKFKPLHQFNPLRVEYIKNQWSKIRNKDLTGVTILDIGCGGGLLTEPLARLGAKVTGIDASNKNIEVAKLHAKQKNLDIKYLCISAEQFAEEKSCFDIVLNMEILEHVADVDTFLCASSALVKTDGLMFIATMNRTVKSFAFAIIGAEYLLRWLPKGTHDWHRFLKPSEIEKTLRANNLTLQEIRGVTYNPFNSSWRLSNDIDVNYIMTAVKISQ